MRRWIGMFLGMAFLAGLTMVIPATPEGPAALQCTLTGQKIETCCCQVRDGKLYCPLADKTIESCCCMPIRK